MRSRAADMLKERVAGGKWCVLTEPPSVSALLLTLLLIFLCPMPGLWLSLALWDTWAVWRLAAACAGGQGRRANRTLGRRQGALPFRPGSLPVGAPPARDSGQRHCKYCQYCIGKRSSTKPAHKSHSFRYRRAIPPVVAITHLQLVVASFGRCKKWDWARVGLHQACRWHVGTKE